MPGRTIVLALVIYGSLAGQVREAVPPKPPGEGGGLQVLLNTAASTFPGKAGIFVKHLTTGEEAAIRGDESFNSASVIKIPVLVMAFQMADRGTLNLDERVTIRKEDIRGGSGIFKYHDPGLQPTWRDVLFQMVITSDNTATDLAIAKVGGVARVNAWLNENKYADALRLVQTTGDLFAKYNALGPNEDRNGKTNADKNYWLGDITPRATARLIEAIEKKTIAKPESCEAMIRMMRAQLAGSRRLPHFITVPVAHKTGDFAPVLANDVGIIYARSGPIVVAFLGNAITGNYGEAEDAEGRFAQKLLEYFDK
jgi:beta-lactamase class A